ncbi:MAG: hypothetical protein ACFFFB_24145, partial [Candidatus Heimdallarchaeota archaeon]
VGQTVENIGSMVLNLGQKSNNQKSLIQLFLLAFTKAKKFNLIESLYDEYLTSIKAIDGKKEF